MVDNTNRIAGVAFVSADGVRLALVGEAKYRPTNPTRSSLVGADGFHGYKEKPNTGMINVKLRDGQGQSVQALGQMTNVTVVLELANGKTVVGRNMFQSGDPPSADAEEAEIELQWEGPDVSEQ